jgi:DNA polymerase III epsilon subunit-like protein
MLGKLIPKVITAEWACSIYSLKYDWAKITFGKQSLDAICEALAIERPSPHNALSDCRALIAALKTRDGSDNGSSMRMERLIVNAWAPSP